MFSAISWTDITAKKWLQQDQDTLKKQMEVITIYMYSPFLYGHAHQSDKVIVM